MSIISVKIGEIDLCGLQEWPVIEQPCILRENTGRSPAEVTTQSLLDLYAAKPWLRDLECSALSQALLDVAVMGA